MKVSIGVTNYSCAGAPQTLPSYLSNIARSVDESALDTLWVADHLLQVDPTATVEEPMLESLTLLGYLAAVTQRTRLGTLVTCASLRPSAVIIKAVTTLDVITGGRAWLGIGAGYHRAEAEMLGLPFPPVQERFELLADTLELANRMWTGDTRPFHGARVRATEPIGNPAPITRPRVLIGGMGEQRTLPLVARYADACNLFDIPDEGATLRRKLDALRRACEQRGRDPEQIEVTLSSRLGPDENVADFAERCANLASIGVDHIIIITSGAWTSAELDRVVASAHEVTSAQR